MNKSILILLFLAGGLAGCTGGREVSYEIPPHRDSATTGVTPDPGTDASAVGTAAQPSR